MATNFKPEERLEEIIQTYGKVMQETDGTSFYDVSVLPYSKNEIFIALLAAIKISDDNQTKEHLKAGLISLAHFQEDIGNTPIKPFDQEMLNTSDKELLDSLKSAEGLSNLEKYNKLLTKSSEESALFMEAINYLNQPNLSHSSFIDAWKNGKIKIDVDRRKALRIANSDALPKRYRAAHIFWSTVWLLTIPLGTGLIFYKWWIGLLVLFVVSPSIANATKTSAMQFMIDHALENEDFYARAIQDGVIHVSEKSS